MSSHSLFEVGLKAFLVTGPRLLLVKEREGGLWELPGGRIEPGEEELPAATILAREIAEELGDDVLFDLEGPVAAWARPGDGMRKGRYVYLVGYLCRYRSGEIRLSDEHAAHAWVDAASWRSHAPAPGYERVLEEFWRGRA